VKSDIFSDGNLANAKANANAVALITLKQNPVISTTKEERSPGKGR